MFLHSPLGEVIIDSCGFSQSNAITNFTLNDTGTYTLTLFDRSDDNRSVYTITARCDAGTCVRFETCNGIPATISGTEEDNVITGTEADIILGTDGNDVIVGLGGNDIIYGLAGDDVICGGDGHDVLIGGDGNDQLFGNADNDILNGDGGNDELNGGDGHDVCDGGLEDVATNNVADMSCDLPVNIP